MEASQVENVISVCSPPNLGKIDNFAATAYLVKKYQECKEKKEKQAYEVIVSKLNTTVKSNFYQILHEGISKKWPNDYVQTRETEYEKLVLTPDGKEAYTQVLNMLDLTYKTVSLEEKEKVLSNENQLIIEKNKEIEVNNTVASTSKSKLNELVPGKSKRAKKEEKLIVILTTNKRGHPNFNEKIKEGVLVESNRWDEGLRNFIQKMEQETRWWDITNKKWIIRTDAAVEKLLRFIEKEGFGLTDEREA
jgi:hypothetical protein